MTAAPDWQQFAIYAAIAAVVILVLQRLPYVGRIFQFVFSFGLLAFALFLLLQQAPFQPTLARITERLGIDNQEVAGTELRVRMSPDGHFWVDAKVNGVPTRMLIDSGATVTAISQQTAKAANIDAGTRLVPVVLRTANGIAPAQTGSVDELRVGNIVARDLKVVTSPGLGELDVIGMNFLSQLESWRVEGRTLVLVPHHPQEG
ncbi:MAG TPA: retropepsin-like aspartic protease [Sphingomicrobium sp.]|jgi:aspartyl protease family protein|nr:retropepsin-like aspartic protease [Sphingomicrobium sp.]